MKSESLREQLGKLIRQVWLGWAHKQPDPKSAWLLKWEQQFEDHREVQRLQGEALYDLGYQAAVTELSGSEIPEMDRKATVLALTQTEGRIVGHALTQMLKKPVPKFAMEKGVMDGLLAKLSPVAGCDLNVVDYFVPADAVQTAMKLKPKYKRREPSKAGNGRVKTSRGLGDRLKRK